MTSAHTPSYPFRGTGAEVQAIEFAYTRSPDQDAAQPAQHPIVVVGAGPVGLSMAIDMAQRGHRVLVLDNDHRMIDRLRATCQIITCNTPVSLRELPLAFDAS